MPIWIRLLTYAAVGAAIYLAAWDTKRGPKVAEIGRLILATALIAFFLTIAGVR